MTEINPILDQQQLGDRVLGGLMGAALGDALGAATEQQD